jgi:hypothetical protein
MNKSLILSGALAFGLSASVLAQAPIQVKYANTIKASEMKERLTYFASDEMKGRDTGSEEQKIAANYLADIYKRFGLAAPVDGSYLQKVELVSTSFGEVSLKVGNQKLVNNENFVFIGDGDMKKKEKVELVFLGLVSEEHLAKVDVKGKLVGVWAVGLKTNEVIKQVMDAGAAGIVIVTMEDQANFDRIATRYKSMSAKGRMGFVKPVEQKPVFMISPDKMAQIFGASVEELKEAAKSNPESIRTQKATYQIEKSVEEVESSNVMAYLEGTDLKDQLVVISSHYDHVGVSPTGEVFNGADDDGSGTISVTEIAEAFALAAKDGHPPRRSILFLNVTGEEKGLLGSEYYSEHPIFPLENTVVDINIDMVGRIDYEYQDAENTDFIYVIGSEMLSTDLKKILEYNNITYSDLIIDYRYDAEDDPNRFYYRSDHYNFAKHNIPVAFFFNGVHDDYHQVTDTVDKIEFPLMEKRAKLIFYTAWDIANREKRLPVDGTNNRTER